MGDLAIFNISDQVRRSYGKLFDLYGLGPVETPYRIVYNTTSMRLRRYISKTMDANPLLLIVPAPIKRAYIWDMDPAISVIARCLESGIGVYMIEWLEQADDAPFGLAEYAEDAILRSVTVMEDLTGIKRPVITGHSLGGTLAAIFSCLHPDRVKGLMLLESPLNFGLASGVFTPFLMHAYMQQLSGSVPGSFLSAVSSMISPYDFIWSRWMDWMKSMDSTRKMFTHMVVERWTLDEISMPGRLCGEVVECLYRENQLMLDKLSIHGKIASPGRFTSPFLAVVNPASDLIPRESVEPFYDTIASNNKQIMYYEGDEGVALQHVGTLVGDSAHRMLWPQLIGWMQSL